MVETLTAVLYCVAPDQAKYVHPVKVPVVLYQIVAPLVEEEIVTDWVLLYVPAPGEKVGVLSIGRAPPNEIGERICARSERARKNRAILISSPSTFR